MIITIIKETLLKNKILELIARWAFMKLPVVYREELSQKTRVSISALEDEFQFIYIHIPKCAGNGVLGSLFAVEGFGHSEIKQIKSKYPEKTANYHKVAVVRNPYSRFESAYYYLSGGGKGKNDIEFSKKYISSQVSINEFVKKLSNDKKLLNEVMRWTHFKPQESFICNDNALCVDQLIRMENLSDGYEKFASIIGILNPPPLKVFNKSKILERESLNLESRKYIFEFYKKDFDILKYEK